jgi:hypothetical protein
MLMIVDHSGDTELLLPYQGVSADGMLEVGTAVVLCVP